MSTLVEQFLRICIAECDSGISKPESPRADVGSPDIDWEHVLTDLTWHRLSPAVSYAFSADSASDSVPKEIRTRLAAYYLLSADRNRRMLDALGSILGAFGREGYSPLVMKGAVLADYFYPDRAARPMGDIDVVLPGADVRVLLTAMGSAGFECRAPETTSDALLFHNKDGVACDLHRRFRLYEKHGFDSLTEQIVPRCLQVPSVRVFEPNAMVAHLVVHMNGHLPKSGPMLLWFLDLAWIIRRSGDRLDPAIVENLLPTDFDVVTFRQMLRFIQLRMGVRLPATLSARVDGCDTLTVEDVLRRRRMRLWGFPGPKGWLRHLAHSCRVPLQRTLPTLRPGDFGRMFSDPALDRRLRRSCR